MAVRERKGTISAPADLATNLKLKPSCSGSLLKRTQSSVAEQWHSWHVELRGVYLCSFKDRTMAKGKGAKSPTSVIDIRNITAATAAARSNELILSSRSREIRFQADPSSSTSSSATTLDEWARYITRVIDSEVESGVPERPHSPDLEISLSDVFEDAPASSAQVGNPLNSGSAVDITLGSTYDLDSPSSRMPERFQLMCILCGIVRGGQTRMYSIYMWAARLLVVLILFFFVFNVVSPMSDSVFVRHSLLGISDHLNLMHFTLNIRAGVYHSF